MNRFDVVPAGTAPMINAPRAMKATPGGGSNWNSTKVTRIKAVRGIIPNCVTQPIINPQGRRRARPKSFGVRPAPRPNMMIKMNIRSRVCSNSLTTVASLATSSARIIIEFMVMHPSWLSQLWIQTRLHRREARDGESFRLGSLVAHRQT